MNFEPIVVNKSMKQALKLPLIALAMTLLSVGCFFWTPPSTVYWAVQPVFLTNSAPPEVLILWLKAFQYLRPSFSEHVLSIL